MGRGRAKAKQTKVARQLKYSSGGTDLDRLQAELAGSEHTSAPLGATETDENDEDDEYASYATYADDDEDDSAEA